MLKPGKISFEKSENNEQDDELIDKLVEKLKSKEEPTEKKVEELLHKSSRTLFQTSTTFPFDLFPDDLIINENKIEIITREFFSTEQIYTVLVKDLADVSVSTIPFLATLEIIDSRYQDTPLKIKYLSREDALTAKKIIQGLILGKEEKIDFSKIKDEDLLYVVTRLGQVREEVY